MWTRSPPHLVLSLRWRQMWCSYQPQHAPRPLRAIFLNQVDTPQGGSRQTIPRVFLPLTLNHETHDSGILIRLIRSVTRISQSTMSSFYLHAINSFFGNSSAFHRMFSGPKSTNSIRIFNIRMSNIHMSNNVIRLSGYLNGNLQFLLLRNRYCSRLRYMYMAR